MTTRVAPLMTTEDLVALPDDGNTYELIEGELVTSCMQPLMHQKVLGNLMVAIKTHLDENLFGEVFLRPGVIFDQYSSVIPDLVFLTNEQLEQVGTDTQIRVAPALAVEVVSPGRENARRDRVMKLQVYGEFGVGECWVADPEARTIEIYRQSDGALALATTVSGDDELTTPLLPGFSLKAARVFGG